MREAKWRGRLAVAVLIVVLAAGIFQARRPNSGSSYATYSSLSTAPSGTKLIFDALAATGKFQVRRNYLPLNQLSASDAVVLYLTGLGFLPKAETLEGIARSGNRLIVGLADDLGESVYDAEQKSKKQSKKEQAEKEEENDTVVKWAIRFGDWPPVGLPWRPVDGVENAWEQPFGKGSIVLLFHANRLTNKQTIAHSEARALLPTLLGSRRNVVFEESHLGVVESGSVAGLARRYGLQGLCAGLIVLFILFVWNRSVSFPPPSRFAQERSQFVAGTGSRGLLAGLLTRYIPPGALIETCRAEWNRAQPRKKAPEIAIPQSDPISAYRQIQEEIHRKHAAI